MRAVIQRVSSAEITINGTESKFINYGLVVFAAIEDEDDSQDIIWLVNKIINMRIFDNDKGVMDLSLLDTSSDMLIVSQFTLFASTRKGNRPSYLKSSKSDFAIPIYDRFVTEIKNLVKQENKIETGVFGADMKVSLVNDGPVTIIIDSKLKE